MNKIESGEKLDFNNVLIRPKRSTINSRSEVSLERTFKFKHSSFEWTGSANHRSQYGHNWNI